MKKSGELKLPDFLGFKEAIEKYKNNPNLDVDDYCLYATKAFFSNKKEEDGNTVKNRVLYTMLLRRCILNSVNKLISN